MNYSIFDGHNDVLFRLFLKNKINAHEDFLLGDNEGHLDLPRMEEVDFRGGFLQFMFLHLRLKLAPVINLSAMTIWKKMNIPSHYLT